MVTGPAAFDRRACIIFTPGRLPSIVQEVSPLTHQHHLLPGGRHRSESRLTRRAMHDRTRPAPNPHTGAAINLPCSRRSRASRRLDVRTPVTCQATAVSSPTEQALARAELLKEWVAVAQAVNRLRAGAYRATERGESGTGAGWPTRYATVSADDPPSRVLTLTRGGPTSTASRIKGAVVEPNILFILRDDNRTPGGCSRRRWSQLDTPSQITSPVAYSAVGGKRRRCQGNRSGEMASPNRPVYTSGKARRSRTPQHRPKD